MKNIIIIGPSRVGKTTLSSILCEKYNLNYISGDSIRNAFINIYPVLGYTPKNTIERIEFCKFINWLIKENNVHLKRDIYYVIDSADISLDNAIQIFDDAIIIGVGCKDITIQDMIEKMKKNDTKLEWTYGYSDDDLYSVAKETITNSKELYKKCLNSNVFYFDTSIDRYKTYEEILKYIENEILEKN